MSRLVVFNETFASLSGEKDYAILWHEALVGRQAHAVASAYIRCITLCGKKKVIFWADNCTAQNKNWLLYTALAWCVHQEWGPESIIIRYLERGHTTMRADSIHGNIAIKMKRRSHVYDFDDVVEICDSATSNMKSIVMQLCDFYLFVAANRLRQTKKVAIPQLNRISRLHVSIR